MITLRSKQYEKYVSLFLYWDFEVMSVEYKGVVTVMALNIENSIVEGVHVRQK